MPMHPRALSLEYQRKQILKKICLDSTILVQRRTLLVLFVFMLHLLFTQFFLVRFISWCCLIMLLITRYHCWLAKQHKLYFSDVLHEASCTGLLNLDKSSVSRAVEDISTDWKMTNIDKRYSKYLSKKYEIWSKRNNFFYVTRFGRVAIYCLIRRNF